MRAKCKKVRIGVAEQEVVDVLKQRRKNATEGCKNGVNVGMSKERRPRPSKREAAGRENTGRGLKSKAATHGVGEGNGPEAVGYVQFREVRGRTVAGSKEGLELGQGKGWRFGEKGLGKGVETTQVANEARLSSRLVCQEGG